MAEECDMEGIVSSSLNTRSERGTLVEVKFQKDPYQSHKYLEAEPKALGVTQIMLSLFLLNTLYLNWDNSVSGDFNTIAIVGASFSSTGIIAGSVAIAAQNLHLPTLKACLGMQVVSCVFSVFCFVFISSGQMVQNSIFHYCRFNNPFITHYDHNDTSATDMCNRLWSIYEHVIGIELLVQATQIAISATLAGFCCKVIQSCSPKRNVPVVVLNTDPSPQ